ncbi:MAG TPA: peptidase M48 [Rhodobacteraceae bacterium]|nr:peptidase M48 [Paracoccaceae bacterium]
MFRSFLLVALMALLAACDLPAPPPTGAPGAPVGPGRVAPDTAARNFIEVVNRVEPVAEELCRSRTRGIDCDLLILVDDRPGAGVNAFQSVDRRGRPVIVFTLGIIAEARNADELAFVLGHEAAHHFAGHLQAQQENAAAGAIVFEGLAARSGLGARDIVRARELGALIGTRAYSKAYELEADRLGTIITWRAGYDPLRGAEFFTRIPDPGDEFLGTHPPNAARMQAVRDTLAQLRAGRGG